MKLTHYRMLEAFRAKDAAACYAILQEHFGVRLPDATPMLVTVGINHFFAWDDECFYVWKSDSGFHSQSIAPDYVVALDTAYSRGRCCIAEV